MYIFKLTKGTINVEEQKENLSNQFDKELNKEIEKLTPLLKDGCIKHLKKFDVEVSERTIDIVINNLIESTWITNKKLRYSMLFNYFPVYDLLLEEEQKDKIYEDFLKLQEKIEQNQNLVSLCSKYKELDESTPEKIEVAYWRKYHRLNDYILTKFGKGNYENIVLSLENLKDIRGFIKNDNEDVSQIDEIIKNWSNDCTYMYNHWA